MDHSTPESAVGEMQTDTVTDPQLQTASSEGPLPKACGLEQSGKDDDSTPLGSSLESLRLKQLRPNAVIFTDSGYFSVDSPPPHPLVQDLDSFNVVSLRGGRPKAKEGKKPSYKKGGAKGKRPSAITETPLAPQSVPGEPCQPYGLCICILASISTVRMYIFPVGYVVVCTCTPTIVVCIG